MVTCSIIVPIYNCSIKLPECILNSRINKEIILINDGSTDNSADICREYSKKYGYIKFIDKPHTGVSDTRNIGIKAAKGKYIMFLDADDDLAEGSIEALVEFFDFCYDEVDMVTYPIETHWHGQILPPHFRYKTMTYSGIYDLNLLPYIGQTTMNIVVKNKFENNILFDTSMTFSEDQNYCSKVLKNKMKIGFCKDAKYIYYRSEQSSSGKLNGACYIFEQSMRMFEDMFSEYKDNVPAAIQGLYINDLEWKMRSNILFPVHYEKEELSFANERIDALLMRVENSIILNHPEIDFFHKYFWLKRKKNSSVVSFFEPGVFGLKDGDRVILKSEKIEIVVTRIRLDGDKFIFRGFLKSAVFNFCGRPELYAYSREKRLKVELYESAYSFYLCHTKTNLFYAFCLELDVDSVKNLGFVMCIGGREYKCRYYFMPKSPFSHEIKRYDAVIGSKHIHYNTNKGEFIIDDKHPFDVYNDNSNNTMIPSDIVNIRQKAAILSQKRNICLYYDCRGVVKDNGYYRFMEDIDLNDGCCRYYVYDDNNKNITSFFKNKYRKYLIPFGSMKHKIYLLAARKIVTAYIEDINFIPFNANDFKYISDFFGFETEYIQHGILHASMPWKYTPEVIMADKICISTDYEQNLFENKYKFRSEDIIRRIMPRLKTLDKKLFPQKRILFAPSWRQYLIGPNIDGKWQPCDDLFLSSDYYKNIMSFLTSQQLSEYLESNNYQLDFKIHPIFSCYLKFFDIDSKNIHIVLAPEPIEQYEIMITDFSSFLFDFLYLDRKIFSFIPDKMQFESGMNSYSEIEPESECAIINVSDAEEFIVRIKSNNQPKRITFFE